MRAPEGTVCPGASLPLGLALSRSRVAQARRAQTLWAPAMKRGAAAPRKSYLLDVVTDAELRDELTVVVDVVLLDVAEKTTTLADEHQEAATGVEVLLV